MYGNASIHMYLLLGWIDTQDMNDYFTGANSSTYLPAYASVTPCFGCVVNR